jgi:hypothetical protein
VVAAPGSMYGAGLTNDGVNNCTGPVSSGGNINCLDIQNPVSGFTPTANQVWQLAAIDGNGDGVMGIPMAAGGPFAGFNAGFNASFESVTPDAPAVPVPAAVWLLGSGLAGLAGIGRRKNKKA